MTLRPWDSQFSLRVLSWWLIFWLPEGSCSILWTCHYFVWVIVERYPSKRTQIFGSTTVLCCGAPLLAARYRMLPWGIRPVFSNIVYHPAHNLHVRPPRPTTTHLSRHPLANGDRHERYLGAVYLRRLIWIKQLPKYSLPYVSPTMTSPMNQLVIFKVLMCFTVMVGQLTTTGITTSKQLNNATSQHHRQWCMFFLKIPLLSKSYDSKLSVHIMYKVSHIIQYRYIVFSLPLISLSFNRTSTFLICIYFIRN